MISKTELHFFTVFHCGPVPIDLWTGLRTGVWEPLISYNLPFKGNCLADVAPGVNEFDTPGLKVHCLHTMEV